MTLVGKQELLQWALQTTQLLPCAKYDDLKDGLIFVSLMEKLFPNVIDNSIVRNQRGGQRNSRLNWELLRNAMETCGLPTSVCDRKGISAGHQKPCYNMLVMLFFLHKLRVSSDFAVDFAHPIDDALAEFLQSPKSLEVLKKAAGVSTAQDHPSVSLPEAGARSMSPAHPVSSPSSKPASSTPVLTSQPRPSSQHQPSTPRQNTVNQGRAPPQDSTSGSLHALLNTHVTHWTQASHQIPGEAMIQRLRAAIRSGERQLQLAQSEIAHIKQLSKHTVESQRTLVESEMMRASEQFHAQLSSVKMQSLHDAEKVVQQCLGEVDRVVEEVKMERESLQYLDDVDHRQELGDLRQLRVALEGRQRTLETLVENKDEMIRALQDQIHNQAKSLETIHRQQQDLQERLGHDAREIVLEHATDLENNAVRQKLYSMQKEIESLKITEMRFSEEIRQYKEELKVVHGQGYVSEKAVEYETEINSLHEQIHRLRKANTFLHEKVRRVGGGDAVPGDKKGAKQRQQQVSAPQVPLSQQHKDLHGDTLEDGSIHIPSSIVNALRSEEYAANVLHQLQRVQDQLNPSDWEELHAAFWDITSVVTALQNRINVCGESIRSCHAKYLGAVKQGAIDKLTLEQQLSDARQHIHRLTRTAEQEGTNERNRMQLEFQLVKDELTRSQHEVSNLQQRLRNATGSILHEAEAQQHELHEKVSQLNRLLGQYKARDSLWQAYSDILRHSLGNPNYDRRETERKIHSLSDQLQQCQLAIDALQHRDHLVGEGNSQQQRAGAAIQREYDSALEELAATRDEAARLREKNRMYESEMERLRQKIELDQGGLNQASQEIQDLKEQLLHLGTLRENALASYEADHTMWAAEKKELEEYCSSLMGLVGDRSSGGNSRHLPDRPHHFGASMKAGTKRALDAEETMRSFTQQHQERERKQRPDEAMEDDKSMPSITSLAASSPFQQQLPASSPWGKSKRDLTGGNATPPPLPSSKSNRPSEVGSVTTTTTTTTGKVGLSSILSPDELERRKQEILSKYGVGK